MINPINSLILAHTKLKSRKLRTIVTVIVSSLMFSILALAVILFEGAYNTSFNKMSEGTIYSRNFVLAYPQDQNDIPFGRQPLTAEEKATLDKLLNEEIIARKNRSKQLGLDFDEKQARANLMPYQVQDKDRPNDFYLNESSIIARRFIAANPQSNFYTVFENAKQLAKKSGASQPFVATSVGINQHQQVFNKNKDGKYDFSQEMNREPKPYFDDSSNDSTTTSLTLAPETIYQTFLFKNHGWAATSGKIPILLQLSRLEKMLGMQPLDKKAPLDQQLVRIQQIREKAVGLEFNTCALNSLAMEQQNQALAYKKASADQQKTFDIAYETLNNSKCATPTVIKDSRSAEEKKHAANLMIFNHEFDGQPAEAQATELTFQVVGALPNSLDWSSGFLESIVQSLAGKFDFTSIVPSEMFFKMQNLKAIQSIYDSVVFDENNFPKSVETPIKPAIYMEYSTPEQARQAIDNFSCEPDFASFENGKFDQAYAECVGIKSFYLSTFGSRAADLIQVKKIFYQSLKIVGIVFAAIATIIMAGTVGRLIGDSRRETAVFRAIGFKRFDISAIYLTYSLLISILIIITAFAIAAAVAIILNYSFAPDLTARMVWLYGLQDNTFQFTLLGFNLFSYGIIAGTIVTVGIISTILPLLRNIRRNPIKDMRDE